MFNAALYSMQECAAILALSICKGLRSTTGSADSAALFVPDVVHEALPAVRFLRERVLHLLRLAVARNGFLHLLVDLAQRQAAGAGPELRRHCADFLPSFNGLRTNGCVGRCCRGAFQLVGIVSSHADRGDSEGPYVKLEARSRRKISMSGNTFGLLYCVTSFGESHGPAYGGVVDGCPPGLELAESHIQKELDRRKPGSSRHVTQRQESDRIEILSGVFEGR